MAKFADQVVVQPTDEAAAGQGAASGIAQRVVMNSTRTSKSAIGQQIRATQTVDNTSGESVIGAEVSARVNDDVDAESAIGLKVDAYLRGTAAKTMGGDVRGLNLEVVTDDGGTNTIDGDVSMLRFRAAFSASTLTGNFVPIRIEKAEAQTNSQQFDAVLELPSTNAGVWHDTEDSGTENGFIKVLVNGNARYIQLYSATPS